MFHRWVNFTCILMAFVTTLHLQASADAVLSCKPVQPVTGCGSNRTNTFYCIVSLQAALFLYHSLRYLLLPFTLIVLSVRTVTSPKMEDCLSERIRIKRSRREISTLASTSNWIPGCFDGRDSRWATTPLPFWKYIQWLKLFYSCNKKLVSVLCCKLQIWYSSCQQNSGAGIASEERYFTT